MAQFWHPTGSWLYAIDPAYAPDGPDAAVPPEGIIGAWKIADDGTPAGEYQANPRYGSGFARRSHDETADIATSSAGVGPRSTAATGRSC